MVILFTLIYGPAEVSRPSYGGTGLGELGGTVTVSVTVITSVIVNVLLVAVPKFSKPAAVLEPELVRVASDNATVIT
jgi:hypothetical protein